MATPITGYKAICERFNDKTAQWLDMSLFGFTPWTVCQKCAALVDATNCDKMGQKHPEVCIEIQTRRICRSIESAIMDNMKLVQMLPEGRIRKELLSRLQRCCDFINYKLPKKTLGEAIAEARGGPAPVPMQRTFA